MSKPRIFASLLLLACFQKGAYADRDVLPRDCPELTVKQYDNSVDFSGVIHHVKRAELVLSGIGIMRRNSIVCEARGSCFLDQHASPISKSYFVQRLSGNNGPNTAGLAVKTCNYTVMAERWRRSNPSIPIKLTGSSSHANPQGFYMYVGTRKRGPLLEIHHPFFGPERLHSIQSMAKALVSCVVHALQEQGVLNVTTPIYTYLPVFNKTHETRSITLEDILTHSSGYTDVPIKNAGHPDLSLAQVAELIIAHGLQYTPKTQSVYSNLAIKLAGAVVESVTGKRWNEVWTETIARPLGIEGSLWYDGVSNKMGHNVTNPQLGYNCLATPAHIVKVMRFFSSQGLNENGTVILSQKSIQTITAWSGSTPFCTLNGTSIGVPPPCKDGLDQGLTFQGNPPFRSLDNEFIALGLKAHQAAGATHLAYLTGYGRGIFMNYDLKCRKCLRSISIYGGYWIVMDAEGDDPIEYYLSSIGGYHSVDSFGNGAAILAAEAVWGGDAFLQTEKEDGTCKLGRNENSCELT